MSDRTATERLRELLDERGVEYYESPNGVAWGKLAMPIHGRMYTHYAVELDGLLCVDSHCITPKQAVEATLGRPKVRKVRGMTYDERGGEVYFIACSGCGEWIDGDLGCIGEFDGPNYCPNCGGEFDGPMLCKSCGKLADFEYGGVCAECYEAGES